MGMGKWYLLYTSNLPECSLNNHLRYVLPHLTQEVRVQGQRLEEACPVVRVGVAMSDQLVAQATEIGHERKWEGPRITTVTRFVKQERYS